MADRPIADGLYTAGTTPRLIGGRRLSDGRITFPMPQRGEAAFYEPIELAREGKLWSWTVQRFRPKSPPYAGPEAFRPFPLGYVELPGEVIVESLLVDVEPTDLRIGMPLELAIVPFNTDAMGDTVTTYAFRPMERAA